MGLEIPTELLLRSDINQRVVYVGDYNFNTALAIALKFSREDLIALLLKYGATVWFSYLFYAIRNSSSNVVKLLLENIDKIILKKCSGDCINRLRGPDFNEEKFDMLINYGCDINNKFAVSSLFDVHKDEKD